MGQDQLYEVQPGQVPGPALGSHQPHAMLTLPPIRQSRLALTLPSGRGGHVLVAHRGQGVLLRKMLKAVGGPTQRGWEHCGARDVWSYFNDHPALPYLLTKRPNL